jgi:hypothetical protein
VPHTSIRLEVPKAEVDIDGLAFEDAGHLTGDYGRLTLHNCSLWGFKEGLALSCVLHGPGQAARFVNSLFTSGPACSVGPGQGILLENCIVPRPSINARADDDDCEMVIRRSLCWAATPLSGTVACDGNPRAQPRVRAEDSVFVGGGVLTGSAGRARWSGTHNVYGLSAGFAVFQQFYTLEAWQKRWDSDRDSVVTPSPFLEPRMWRFIPGQPKRPGGRDYGANVYMVARTAGPADQDEPFAVLRPAGQVGRLCPTLEAAVAEAASGDVIEIRGDGPFPCDPIDLGARDLVIRAGSGFRPRLRFGSLERARYRSCLFSEGRLVLEGLELSHQVRPPENDSRIALAGTSLHMAHCCSLLGGPGIHAQCNGSLARLHHCEFRIGAGAWYAFTFPTMRGKALVEGCVFSAPDTPQPYAALHLRFDRPLSELSLEVRHNTFLNASPFSFILLRRAGGTETARKVGTLRLSENVFASREILQYVSFSPWKNAVPPGEGLPLLPSVYDWKEERNAYASGTAFLMGREDNKPSAIGRDIKSLTDWSRWWGVPASSSVQGDIRFTGPLPAEQELGPMSPAQLRLAPDSIGKAAGPGGRDLGADVDALGPGPGPAYEAWKQTADYRQWRKDTGR